MSNQEDVDYIKLNPPKDEILFQKITKIIKYTFPLIVLFSITLFVFGLYYVSKLNSPLIITILLIIMGTLIIIIIINYICLYKTYYELSKEKTKQLDG
jgi:hypothetical protein